MQKRKPKGTCNPNLVNWCFLFRLYNHIQLSSNLMSGCDYSLFKVECFYIVFLKKWQLQFISQLDVIWFTHTGENNDRHSGFCI